MVQPLVKVKSVKKRTNPFKRHQCDRKIAVKVGFGWKLQAFGSAYELPSKISKIYFLTALPKFIFYIAGKLAQA